MLLLLVAARLLPVALLLRVPLLVRVILALLLAALLAPVVASAALPSAPLALALLALKELAVGAILALLIAVPFLAARAAGAVADAGIGAESRIAELALLLAAVVFFAAGGHLLAVQALAASYQAVPLGVPLPASAALQTTVIEVTSHLILAAVGLAAPVLAALLLADLTLALVGRAARGLPLAEAAGPLRAGATIFAVLASLAGLALALRGELGYALSRLSHPFG